VSEKFEIRSTTLPESGSIRHRRCQVAAFWCLLFMLNEFRDAIVGYARSWRTTVTVAVLLGLGVGASSATIGIMASMVRNPIGVDAPGELVVLDGALPSLSGQLSTGTQFLDYKSYLPAFRELAAYSDHEGGVNLGVGRETIRAQGAEVTGNFFSAMGVAPQAGRGFAREEGDSGRNRVVVLSHSLWKNVFGASQTAVGESVTLNGVPFTVVGVAPAGFRFPRDAEFWIPVSLGRDRIFTGSFVGYSVFGRLGSGHSIEQARANLDAFVHTMKREAHDSWVTRRPVTLVPMAERIVAGVRLSLLTLVLAAGLIWIVSCANASHLLLARTLTRMKEIAIRTALGASPGRIAAHFFAEACLLAVLGAASGLLLAAVALRLAITYMPAEYPRVPMAGLLPWVFALDLALSFATGLVAVLPGIIQVGRHRAEWLRSFGSGTAPTGADASRLAKLLVVSQVALASVLMTGAFGLARTLTALQNVDTGFSTSNKAAMGVSLPAARYPSPVARTQFFDELLRRTRSLPRVVAADATNALPLGKADTFALLCKVIGQPEPKDFAERFAVNVGVTENYLKTTGVALLEGRYFSAEDAAVSAPVVIVSRAFARRHWGSDTKAAIGRRLEIAGTASPAEIVGVVADVTQFSLRAKPEPQIYRPHRQAPITLTTVVVEASGDPQDVVPLVRSVVKSLDPEVALYGVTTLDQLVRQAAGRERLLSYIMGIFASLAVTLAAIGVYAAMSRYVLQRRHELGVRIALGAGRRRVLTLVLGQGVRLAGTGVAVGTLLALLSMQTMAGSLFGLAGTDPWLCGAAAVLLFVVGIGACVAPANSASTVDPLVALKNQ
jgi:putative ABC transport system permease protein